MATISDPPTQDNLVQAIPSTHPMAARLPKLVMSKKFVQWLGELIDRIQSAPSRVARTRAAGQTATIGVTPIPAAIVTAAVWRVSYEVRVEVPASVSSSLQVTIHWTRDGVAQSETGGALVGNTTTTREGATRVFRADAGTPISYAIAYGSVGTPMQYGLDVSLEEVGADG